MSERSPRLFGLPPRATTFVGFIAAPALGGSLGTFLLFLIQALTTDNVIDLSGWLAILSEGFVIGLICGIPASFVVGLPVHTVMMRKGLVRFWHYAFFGCLIGAINVLLIILTSGASVAIWLPASWLGVCGAIGGLTFWLIRRPDRDAVSAQPQP